MWNCYLLLCMYKRVVPGSWPYTCAGVHIFHHAEFLRMDPPPPHPTPTPITCAPQMPTPALSVTDFGAFERCCVCQLVLHKFTWMALVCTSYVMQTVLWLICVCTVWQLQAQYKRTHVWIAFCPGPRDAFYLHAWHVYADTGSCMDSDILWIKLTI